MNAATAALIAQLAENLIVSAGPELVSAVKAIREGRDITADELAAAFANDDAARAAFEAKLAAAKP